MKYSVQLRALAMILAITCGKATASDSATPVVNAVPMVVKVWPTNLALGSTISVLVTNLNEWAQLSPDNDPTKLVPLINGRQLDGLYPTETYLKSSILSFRLALTDVNRDAWTDLLGKPKSFGYPVSFTVGMGGKERFQTAFDYQHKNLHLTIISPKETLFSMAFAAITGIALIWMSRKTDLIRDNTILPPPPGKRRPYSLGRTQMAFWFFLVLTSYVGLWMITGSLETITPSILVIMGISAGTTLGAALIDADKNEKKSELAPVEMVSKGFLHDLLSDGSAYSFHRFQIFVWTLVLGIIFVASVYNGLSMPEFNSTLLGLMGISAGAYVGLKFPEK